MFPALYSAYRKELESRALFCICPCYYYDLADCITEMSDDELQNIIDNDGMGCNDCK